MATNTTNTESKKGVWSVIVTVISSILKLPNWVWEVPLLNKLKGFRLILSIGIAAVFSIFHAMDWHIISEQICNLYHLAKPESLCDPGSIEIKIISVFTGLATSLKLEDMEEKAKFLAGKK